MRNGIYINETEITRFLHTRGGFMFVTVIAVAATLAAFAGGVLSPLNNNEEFIFIPPGEWIQNPYISLAVCLCANIITGYGVVLISKHFNTIRSMSRLAATLFIVMQTATPALMGCFYSGTFIALVMVTETVLLFSMYDDRTAVRRIFLLFFIIATSSLFCLPLLFYIPFLWLGLMQMKIFNFRAVMASLIGIITPLWILFGFGLLTADDLRMPELNMIIYGIPYVSMPLLCAIILSAAVGVLFLISNLMKLLSYNAQIRAYNGFFILMLFSSMILMIVNTDAIAAYIPVLNLAAAYQTAHFFAERRHRRSYIAILATFLPFIAIYLWNLI